jgi:hypothetical protein
MISAMSNGIPLISQHSVSRKYESLIRWLNVDPGMSYWITNPNPNSG